MHSSGLLLTALATLSVATTTNIAPAQRASLPHGQKLTLRQADLDVCVPTADEQKCEDLCIPDIWHCCHDGESGSCEDGYYCDGDGCCPTGKQCSGPPTGCTKSFKECGDGCIPKDAVCCFDFWCAAGTTCGKDDCVDPSGHTLSVSALTSEGSPAPTSGSQANGTKSATTTVSSSRAGASTTSDHAGGATSTSASATHKPSTSAGGDGNGNNKGNKDSGSAAVSAPLALLGSLVGAFLL